MASTPAAPEMVVYWSSAEPASALAFDAESAAGVVVAVAGCAAAAVASRAGWFAADVA